MTVYPFSGMVYSCIPYLRSEQPQSLNWSARKRHPGKEPTCQCRRHKRCRFDPWEGKIPWRRAWPRTPVFLPGESCGQRSLAGYSPWGGKDSDTTEVIQHTAPWQVNIRTHGTLWRPSHSRDACVATSKGVCGKAFPWTGERGQGHDWGQEGVSQRWCHQKYLDLLCLPDQNTWSQSSGVWVWPKSSWWFLRTPKRTMVERTVCLGHSGSQDVHQV